jgi:Na+-translocating ferredoxin:NAD+ oxidoreductase subunit D
MGVIYFGAPAVAVISMSVASAILWEFAVSKASKRPNTVGDGNAALVGLIFGMLLPATAPWWLVITGTFVAIVIGKHIFGGVAPTHSIRRCFPTPSWRLPGEAYFDFDAQLDQLQFDLRPFTPGGGQGIRRLGGGIPSDGPVLSDGRSAVSAPPAAWPADWRHLSDRPRIHSLGDSGGVHRRTVHDGGLFHMADPGTVFVGPMFHLLTGYYSLIGAIFLATEDSSSPVNTVPMLIYGVAGGVMTMLIRNIGAYADGTIYAILLINLINPLIDKIRPRALGKVA